MREAYRALRGDVLKRVAGAVAPGTSRAVSLCCGRGAELVVLSRALGPECTVVGVDDDPVALMDARRRVADLVPGGVIDLVRADAGRYELSGATFACCCFGLGHLAEPRQAVQRWLRTMGPAGRLLLVDWDAVPLTEYASGHSDVQVRFDHLEADGVVVRVAEITKGMLG